MQTGHCFQERKKKKSRAFSNSAPKSSFSRPVTGLMSALEIKYSEVSSYRKHTGLSNVTQNYSGRGNRTKDDSVATLDKKMGPGIMKATFEQSPHSKARAHPSHQESKGSDWFKG